MITAVTTPFTASGDLDCAAPRLFALVTAATGRMFVAGTTGKFPPLEDAEGPALVETARTSAPRQFADPWAYRLSSARASEFL